MWRCIYCVEEKGEERFQKAEHVMPRSFGIFQDSFTLNRVVCDGCNQHFGEKLELVLGRDTYEGHARVAHGVKKPEDFRTLRHRRVTYKLAEGPFAGCHAYLEYSEKAGNVQLFLFPQVGFLISQANQYEYFLLNDIPTLEALREKGFKSGDPQSILAVAVESETLKSALAEKGISFQISGDAIPGGQAQDILTEKSVTIDDTVWRAIAKIAFNYLAYWQGSEFTLHPAFDGIRRYIRYGERSSNTLIEIVHDAILGDEPVEGLRRLGNLVTMNVAIDGVSVFAQVSLLNILTYRILLAPDFPDQLPSDIKRGHFFDVTTHRIYELEPREKNAQQPL
jgi:hypothetical protein